MSKNKNENQDQNEQLIQPSEPEEVVNDKEILKEDADNGEAIGHFDIEESDTNTLSVNNEDISEEDDEEQYDEEKKDIHPIFKKLASLSPKHAKIFQIIYGFFCGVVCYSVLLLENFFPRMDKLLVYGCYALIAVIIFFSFNLGKKTGWDMIPYRIGLIIGIATGIVANLIYLFATGKL